MADRLTHILVECPALIASVQVGVLNALAPLEGRICEVRFRETRRLKRKDIQWCDIFVCVRVCMFGGRKPSFGLLQILLEV